MTILVDAARWPWRGTKWCHLVSDSNLEELHSFAAGLGCRRVGFQGDHYDIDVDTRAVAVERGAIECDSRELVRRIRNAGLRIRPSTFEKWSLVTRGTSFSRATLEELTSLGHAPFQPLRSTLEALPRIMDACHQSSGWFALRREDAAAVVVHGSRAGVVGTPGLVPVADDESTGLFVRVEPGQPATWTIELISPTPQSHQ